MKFKVGDVVELLAPRNGEEEDNFECGWTSAMRDCVGVVKLTNDNFHYDCSGKFRFNDGDYTWTWDERYIRLVDGGYKDMRVSELVKLLDEYESQIKDTKEKMRVILRELNERYAN